MLFKSEKIIKAEQAEKAKRKAEEAFTPDGQPLVGGGMRYKILCDGGINPSGVFWSKTVPAGASVADYRAAQAERDAALKRLKELSGAA